MFKRADVWIAAVIIALCAFAVAKQIGVFDDDGIEPLAVGERLDLSTRLLGIGDDTTTYPLSEVWGERLTVVMTWSVPCPCVEEIEPRVRALYANFPPSRGISWVAVDGEPLDTAKQILRKMSALHAPYHMLRDPQQTVTRRLGFETATQFALLDAQGALLYRGALDDSYDGTDVKHAWFAEALAAADGGTPIAIAETEHQYGCLFSDPASCEQYRIDGAADTTPVVPDVVPDGAPIPPRGDLPAPNGDASAPNVGDREEAATSAS